MGLESFPVTFCFLHDGFCMPFDGSSGNSGSWIFLISSVVTRAGRSCCCICEAFSPFFNCLIFAFLIPSFMFLSTFLGSLRFLPGQYDVMLATSSSPNFTPFRYRASRIGSCGGFSLRSTQSTDLSSAVLAYSLSNIIHCSVFCHFDPCVVILHIISCCRFSLFRLKEFVNLVFPSSFWSSYGSVGFVFCVEFRVPFSCFHYSSLVR